LSENRSGAACRQITVPLLALLISAVAIPAVASSSPPDSTTTAKPVFPLPADTMAAPGRVTIPGTISRDIGAAFDDALGFFTAPFSFGPVDWKRTAAGIGAFGIVMGMDEPLNRLLVSHRGRGALEEPLEWAKEWGRLRSMQYATIGVYFGGLLAGRDDLRITGRLMGEALLLAGAPAIALQYGLGRSRPYDGVGAFRYNFFEWGNEHQSLPSGHATVAFAMSTVLAKKIDRVWAAVPLYAFAGLTALSMAWGNEHWPSDVLLGSALGYLAGSYVVSREEEREAGVEGGLTGTKVPKRVGLGIGPGGVTLTYLIY
jgi:membrane-associated phospholipid phosphatase